MQVTLRTGDLAGSLALYQDSLGMQLLSVQDVPANNFCLYFLAFTEDSPTDPDPAALANREWLWQVRCSLPCSRALHSTSHFAETVHHT